MNEWVVWCSACFSGVELDKHDHRDCTHKKQAWVTVAFWDEGPSLTVWATVFRVNS